MKVSVSLITYQQAKTVTQAVESALQQETDFPFEIVIGDDASTDGTQKLLKELNSKHPERIRLILADQNYGDRGMTNVKVTTEAAKGDYIAFLDGDDFWTAPDKLQRQVDFLTRNPDCSMCAHRVEHLSDSGTRHLSPSPGPGETKHDVRDLLLKNFAPKISSMVRSSAIEALPHWYWSSGVVSADWVLNVMALRFGKIGFLNDVLGVHRVHRASVSAAYGSERMLTDKLRMLELMRAHFPNHGPAFRKAERRIRLKRRVLRFTPVGYRALQRFVASRRKAVA